MSLGGTGTSFGDSGGESTTTASMTQRESALSTEQANILREREAQFQSVLYPEMVADLNEAKLNTVDQPTLREGVQATNRAGEQANTSFQSAMSQRGMSGSGSEVQGLAAIGSARQSSLSRDFFAAQQVAKQNKNNAMQMLFGAAPTPTTAAPVLSSSTTKTDSTQFGKQGSMEGSGLAGLPGGAGTHQMSAHGSKAASLGGKSLGLGF